MLSLGIRNKATSVGAFLAVFAFAAVVASASCQPSSQAPPAATPTASSVPEVPPSASPAVSSVAASVSAPPPAVTATATATQAATESSARVPDVIFVPTPTNVVDKMLAAAALKKNDLVYDLGCGDGRILIVAAKKFGARGVGFDVDPKRVAEATANVKNAGVENLVHIEQKDIFEVDLSPATVVTLYLLPTLNVRLIPQLEKLKPGARVVSHDFDMAGVKEEKVWTLQAQDHNDPKTMRAHYVYLWRAPIRTTSP